SFFEHHPEPGMVPALITALDNEVGEFVRPALVRALAAQSADARARPALVREVGRGQNFFRSAVIEALGDYKAQYAYDAIIAVAKLDGPLQIDAAIALGKLGDKRAVEILSGLQHSAPRTAQPSVAAAICLLGVNCESHEHYLIETLRFSDKNIGFQELLRGAAAGLGALAVAGRAEAADALIDIGIPSRDPTRAPVALALGTIALRNTPLMLDRLAQRAYRSSGVDIDAGNETVRRIKGLARSTFTPGVLSDVGAFGGLFKLDRDKFEEPVLVSSADGVGTKLKLAFMTGRHDTVGADLVNHCVNDILVQGARPLFFLDYLATGRLSPDVAEQVITGVARGCRENGCALLGGETAEMPGFYADGEYDIAGFIVGIVDRDRLIDGTRIAPGDVLIGLPSAGLHTNGYSLARRVFFEMSGFSADTKLPELGGSVGDVLLAPHRPYLRSVAPLLDLGIVKGMAHITGGGITENLPRVLPDGCAAMVDPRAWTPLPVFQSLQARGAIATDEMFRAFNMGIGLILVCAPDDAGRVLATIRDAGEPSPAIIGHVVGGRRVVHYAR